MTAEPTLIIPCPNCKKSVRLDSTNSFKPFCCERCKMADLGDWVNENHKIPGDEASELFNGLNGENGEIE
ncbi:MAG: DNA gyrase inhibitor YacG [Gammaproteobacteria bacterium CG22_combo_CG10-13_8_21_14_all_40_8]|nr:MAG: DNA gyrase inhibitor YacG [Gammaproteobacteria bacterium CG22_combo_CG10-13_8_21_14_all_40_8]